MRVHRTLSSFLAASVLVAAAALAPGVRAAPQAIQTPEQFAGFRIGSDSKLVGWERIVEYMRLVADASPRVHVRELGKSTNGLPFIAVEISAPATLENIDRYKALERRLYFQDGVPTPAERDEIFRDGKAVVLITCNIHATEIGASQMVLELVHRLATDQSAQVQRILDNVIFILVPSLNPDGQAMVTDWFMKHVGTPYEGTSTPWLYHPYVGHDNNRDMYMFTQVESQHTARLLWHDWFPAVWLDEHQMGNGGARIFVMPATDPINPNVDPLIYRWNGILGQSQAAALEAAGKDGIIYNSTYTNFWQGAMAWSGWWHNQVGLLTEVASVRIAAPVEQERARPGAPAATGGRGGGRGGDGPLPAPRDVTPRTEYPRPWMGGRWTLRDIVDYELIVSMALLETAADRRETLLRHIYEINERTVTAGAIDGVAAILIPLEGQQDGREAVHLAGKLRMGGVEISRAGAAFEIDGRTYPAGTLVIPMTQVFARYVKDLLEAQSYPEVRRTPDSQPEPPYDVTAWSLGMLLGVETVFADEPVPAAAELAPLGDDLRRPAGRVTGSGPRFVFDYRGPDTAIAINRLLAGGAEVALEAGEPYARVAVTAVARSRMETIATELGLDVQAGPVPRGQQGVRVRAPRVGLYQPWGGGNMDEGWTRWVLEQYEFDLTTLHNADMRAGGLADAFDVIVLADQSPGSILTGGRGGAVPPEYRGGIGDEGLSALKAFVAAGGTLVTLGAACDLAIDEWPISVRNLKAGFTNEEHFAPGTIVNVQVDRTDPLGFGMAATTYGFYRNSPFFSVADGFAAQRTRVVARYPNTGIVASGWLRGEALMTGRAAVVSIDLSPGRLVLFGLRPQHRAQTHATFPMLFNALYQSTAGR
ncbi:MAG TPA: M14 metallopeptidase family protein [Vicinamibacterales bacterium]|nr:M14 metallopeptidase family protein [Vicinamibacterales bacterium]